VPYSAEFNPPRSGPPFRVFPSGGRAFRCRKNVVAAIPHKVVLGCPIARAAAVTNCDEGRTMDLCVISRVQREIYWQAPSKPGLSARSAKAAKTRAFRKSWFRHTNFEPALLATLKTFSARPPRHHGESPRR